MLKIEKFVVNSFRENTYMVWDEVSLECIIIDAGCYEKEEFERLDRFIEDKALKLIGLVNTHCHIDHVLGIPYFKTKYHLELYAHRGETRLIENAHIMGKIFGMESKPFPPIDRYMETNEIFQIGQSSLMALHVPGHSAGSLAYYSAESGFVITGDALFQGSIGRTDLPGGDYDTLISSIKNNLMVLPSETVIYPGHGESSTIAVEKDSNPFM